MNTDDTDIKIQWKPEITHDNPKTFEVLGTTDWIVMENDG